MSKPLDLDAHRAARADADQSPLPVILGGETFLAIRPLRVSVAVAASEGNVAEAIRGLFGDQAREVLDAGIDLEELALVVEALLAGDDDPGNGSAASSG